jgi:hypothetical protein
VRKGSQCADRTILTPTVFPYVCVCVCVCVCCEQLLDELETVVAPGWKVVDYHGSELFPERWFALVVVLQTDNTVLYTRLQARCGTAPHPLHTETERHRERLGMGARGQTGGEECSEARLLSVCGRFAH